MEVSTVFTFIQGIVWPIIIIIFLIIFYRPIKNLLISINAVVNERGLKLTPTGIEVPSSDAQSGEMKGSHPDPKKIIKVLSQNIIEPLISYSINVNENMTLDEIEKKHSKELLEETKETLQRILKDQTGKISKSKFYENLLCDTFISLYFERYYQRILGSQLIFIEKLYKVKDHVLLKENAENLYKTYYPDDHSTTFERWSEYLIKSNFIKEKDDNYILTEIGKEFFEYVLSRDYLIDKLG